MWDALKVQVNLDLRNIVSWLYEHILKFLSCQMFCVLLFNTNLTAESCMCRDEYKQAASPSELVK